MEEIITKKKKTITKTEFHCLITIARETDFDGEKRSKRIGDDCNVGPR